ncbi:type VII secretion protein EssB/YukC, partial [Bacillus velezensis]|uniref:type VII secretion protein EssB/YukC n=1 Tax=Bacillus velezensis TaxID=492670 RepID=UPI0037C00138
QHYSKLIHTLPKYHAETLPQSLHYHLPSSYLPLQNLTQDHPKNIPNLLTLQSHPNHFLYSIHITTGQNQQPIKIRRNLQYNPYISL